MNLWCSVFDTNAIFTTYNAASVWYVYACRNFTVAFHRNRFLFLSISFPAIRIFHFSWPFSNFVTIYFCSSDYTWKIWHDKQSLLLSIYVVNCLMTCVYNQDKSDVVFGRQLQQLSIQYNCCIVEKISLDWLTTNFQVKLMKNNLSLWLEGWLDISRIKISDNDRLNNKGAFFWLNCFRALKWPKQLAKQLIQLLNSDKTNKQPYKHGER